MRPILSSCRIFGYRIAFGLACAGVGVALCGPAAAEGFRLAPYTKIRLTITQWDAAQGDYRRWDAFSGDMVVGEDGTVALPGIGQMQVSQLDSAALSLQVSDALKKKVGLIDRPDAAIEIIDYPPFYVVGSVTNPGEYRFRPGLTVLQALALGGGQYRQEKDDELKDQVGLIGQQQELSAELLRSDARIARLQAELQQASSIVFPSSLMAGADKILGTEIIGQEQIIFDARAKGLSRQLETVSELRDLLNSEIDVLKQKSEGLDDGIKLVENELAGVKSLVDRGVATVARRSELERALASLRSDRLDQLTATLRARQNLSQASRDAVGLIDQHQTEVSNELQQAQSSRERILIKQDVSRRLLLLSNSPEADGRDATEAALSFQITRLDAGASKDLEASDTTLLEPGDVLKVTAGLRSAAPQRTSRLEQGALAELQQTSETGR